MNERIEEIRFEITKHESNRKFLNLGYSPLFVADERAKIAIIGHAPSLKAQETMIAWGDISGKKLMQWLGVREEIFRDKTKIAFLPMDFYYQGKGKSGDLPPRNSFAQTWHPKILEAMTDVKFFILAGQYAQIYYLGKNRKKNLTETVRNFQEYLPKYFPIVHPSPLNFRWLNKNPWFEEQVIPDLQEYIRKFI